MKFSLVVPLIWLWCPRGWDQDLFSLILRFLGCSSPFTYNQHCPVYFINASRWLAVAGTVESLPGKSLPVQQVLLPCLERLPGLFPQCFQPHMEESEVVEGWRLLACSWKPRAASHGVLWMALLNFWAASPDDTVGSCRPPLLSLLVASHSIIALWF